MTRRSIPHRSSLRAALGDTTGLSLVELIVSMGIAVMVLGSASVAMTQGMRLAETATLMSGMNNTLRVGMDMMVRDMLQVGEGLPTGHAILIPSGAGATQLNLPGPPGSTLKTVVGAEDINAVTPGPGLGPTINGVATDIITVLMADNTFIDMPLVALTNTTFDVAATYPATGATIAIGSGQDRLVAGQLIMLEKGSQTALVEVTAIDANARRVTFANNDSLNLNQTAAAEGNVVKLRATDPTDVLPSLPATQVIPTTATRVRMITYYIDIVTNPSRPRLVRRINNGHPTTFSNTLGTAVAMDIENLQFSYDIADGNANPANVRFTAADLAGTGACSPDPCNTNQIRKINIVLTGRSKQSSQLLGNRYRNMLTSQVSLRGMAFVDEYLAPPED